METASVMVKEDVTPETGATEQTKNSPMLSVVIPAYNEEDGIAEIIERVLAVETKLSEIGVGLELLVVDDGSKDRTAEIVRGYPTVESNAR
jgi:glycosyltransferase involved in cell wall biosynthesis